LEENKIQGGKMTQEQTRKSSEDQKRVSQPGGTKKLPIIGSVRPGLINKDEAIQNRLPMDLYGKTVKEAINYLMGHADETEVGTANSVKQIIGSSARVININNKPANLDDLIEDYLVVREHRGTQYQELEIEVSEVQQGGLYRRLLR